MHFILVKPPNSCPPWMLQQFEDVENYFINSSGAESFSLLQIPTLKQRIDNALEHAFKDTYIWLFHHTHLSQVETMLYERRQMFLGNSRPNLITIANGTSVIPYQNSYVSFEDESYYYSEFFNKKYILTYTKIQKQIMEAKLPKDKNTKFIYFGFFHTKTNQGIRLKKLDDYPIEIVTVEKANGMKDSGFLLYAIREFIVTGKNPCNFTIYMENVKSDYVEHRRVNNIPIVVRITKELSHEKWLGYLKNTVQIFVTASTSDTGNYSLMEAIDTGCHCLAVRSYPYIEYLEKDSHINLFFPFSKNSLSDKLNAIINKKEYYPMRIRRSYWDREAMFNRLFKEIEKDS